MQTSRPGADSGETYLRGLLLDGRRESMQPMAERVGVDHPGFHQPGTDRDPLDVADTNAATTRVPNRAAAVSRTTSRTSPARTSATTFWLASASPFGSRSAPQCGFGGRPGTRQVGNPHLGTVDAGNMHEDVVLGRWEVDVRQQGQ